RMSEPESLPGTKTPVTEGDSVSGAATPEASGESSAPQTAAPVRRRRDPIARWLVLAILIIIILWLVSVASALMFGFLSPAQAPRTEIEHQLSEYQQKTQSGKATAKDWAGYVAALLEAGQISKAESVVNQALKTSKTDKSYVYLSQARVLMARKRYSDAVKAADAALAEAQKETDGEVKRLKAKGIAATAEKRRVPSWMDALLIRAQALAAAGKTAEAIKAYDAFLVLAPTESDVMTVRGLLKVKAGDKAGAEKDFREALRFIPDYQPALDGLKQIGAENK
ncbi:MAG: tetratricopeptide repeat protein, partial [Actinomycetes bacterium]